jgi:phage N-6-adenine-methyltransferase
MTKKTESVGDERIALLRRMEKKLRQEWQTPEPLFAPLHAQYGFTLDAAACPQNAKVGRYCGPVCPADDGSPTSSLWREQVHVDGLKADWGEDRVFVNPGFSSCELWAAKCRHEVRERDCPLAVMICHVSTGVKWWRHCKTASEIIFLEGRVNFDAPTELAELYQATKTKPAGNTRDTAVIVWRKELVGWEQMAQGPRHIYWDWKAAAQKGGE